MSALEGVGGESHTPAALPQVNAPGKNCTEGFSMSDYVMQAIFRVGFQVLFDRSSFVV
jgi:hypothetical protein